MNIKKSEYSEKFDNLRKNRVAVSYYKYGSLVIVPKDTPVSDVVEKETKNTYRK